LSVGRRFKEPAASWPEPHDSIFGQGDRRADHGGERQASVAALGSTSPATVARHARVNQQACGWP